MLQEEREEWEAAKALRQANLKIKKGLKCKDPQGLADHYKRLADERKRKKSVKQLRSSLIATFQENAGWNPSDADERVDWTKRWARYFSELVDKDAPNHVCISCSQLFFLHQMVNFTAVSMEKLGKAEERAERIVQDALKHVAPQHEEASRRRLAPHIHFAEALEDIKTKYRKAKKNAEIFPAQFGSPEQPSVVCCTRCWNTLRQGQAPKLGDWNKMKPEDVPPILSQTNELERQLLARSIIFQKLVSLPRGSQRGVKGLMANIPSSMEHTMDRLNLPQSLTSAQVVAVQLKRDLRHKSQYRSMVIRIARLFGALKELKAKNPFYADVKVDDEEGWAERAAEELPPETRHILCADEESEAQIVERGARAEERELFGPEDGDGDDSDDDELDNDADTFAPPVLPDAAIIPEEGMEIEIDGVHQRRQKKSRTAVDVAPGQGQKPVSVLQDKHVEEKAYPGLYPAAERTYAAERSLKVTLGEWVKNRLTHSDTRFIRDAGYAFFLYQRLQYERLATSISVSLNKRKMVNQFGQHMAGVDLSSEEFYESFIAKDSGYRFLRAIRGTPSYWKNQMNDLIAMVKQLGPPTFFITLSGQSVPFT